VAETVRRVGEPLHGEPFTRLGRYADGAARAIDRVAGDLRDRDLDQLAEDVRGFARRRPAVFVGAGIAAGVIAARFLKSSGSGRAGARLARPRQAATRGAIARQGRLAGTPPMTGTASRDRRG
jgi:hypothetical protein